MVKLTVNGSSLTSTAIVYAERVKTHREVRGPKSTSEWGFRGPCLPPNKPKCHLLMETTPAVTENYKFGDIEMGHTYPDAGVGAL